MTPKLLIRVAAGCLLFFALGHSVGHITRHDVTDPKAREVLESMTANKFNMFGMMRSYDENYTGMSFNLIFTLLAFVAILWSISSVANSNASISIKILLAIAMCSLAFSVTGFLFFFLVPAVTCLIAFLLLCVAIQKLNYQQKS